MDTVLLNDLKHQIARKLGKTPNTQKDLELLKSEMLEEANLVIGFNTLRRFYGKLESRKPQVNTLNLLCQYLGFENFQDFSKHHNKNDEWYTWKRMNILEYQDMLQQEDTAWLNSVKLKRDYPVMISYLIKSYIHNEQFANLHQLFASDCLTGLIYENQMKIGNSLGLYFRKLPKSKHEKLYSFLRYLSFRNIALYLFIDYDSFDGYYIHFLRRAVKYISDYEEELFISLILNYKKYLTRKGVPADLSATTVTKTIHPILAGRYFGYRICITGSIERKSIIKEMLAAGKRFKEKISFFLEIIPALLLTREIKILERILEDYYSDMFNIKYWSQNDEVSLYRIGEAFVHIYNMHFQKAQETLHKIDLSLVTDSYYSYSSLFFKIAEYQTERGLHGSSLTLKQIEKEYNELVLKTGFKRFSKNYLKNNESF
jgi:hypothetical protein